MNRGGFRVKKIVPIRFDVWLKKDDRFQIHCTEPGLVSTEIHAAMDTNVLHLGDNLDVLSRFSDSCVDLIYLDPPFNSNRNFSVLFKDRTGHASEAQQNAFEDTWSWTEISQRDFTDLVTRCPVQALVATMEALERIVEHGPTLAYLTSMATRLVEMHRVLKPTGSLYLHCDTTAAAYLKIVLDSLFGARNFRNEIVWKRSDAHNDAKKQYGNVTDRILFYVKTPAATFNPQYGPMQADTLRDWYQYLELTDGSTRRMTREERDGINPLPPGARRFNTDNMSSPNPRPNLMYEYKGYKPHANGWRYSLETMQELDAKGLLVFPAKPEGRIMRKKYLDESRGVVLGDLWADISMLRGAGGEQLGYPTQKPVALLERIISASSNEGDVVLDTYCGCGTALVAAHALRRKWIGVDVTRIATTVMKTRMESEYPELALNGGIRVIGDPTDVESAVALADKDKHAFQIWACSLVGAYPLTKKGADGGVDGFLNFVDYDEKLHRAIVQVKGGKNVSVKDVREFQTVMTREKATLGFFICLADVKHTMAKEALEAGMWKSAGGVDYPRVQVLTVAELMRGQARPRLPVQEKKSILDYKAGRRGRHNTQQELQME